LCTHRRRRTRVSFVLLKNFSKLNPTLVPEQNNKQPKDRVRKEEGRGWGWSVGARELVCFSLFPFSNVKSDRLFEPIQLCQRSFRSFVNGGESKQN
jgi:hypothetical protein